LLKSHLIRSLTLSHDRITSSHRRSRQNQFQHKSRRPDERNPRRSIDRAYLSFIFEWKSPVGYRIRLMGSASEGRQCTLAGRETIEASGWSGNRCHRGRRVVRVASPVAAVERRAVVAG
jgi:hypothetical protein